MNNHRFSNYLAAIVLTFPAIYFSGANASEMVYTPINPSFGGHPNNGSFLLGSASAQKQFSEEREEQTPLQEFNERLQRSLLGRITSVVTRDIVDSDGNISPGTFETVDYTIIVTDTGGGLIKIETIDKVTGESTIIEVQNQP